MSCMPPTWHKRIILARLVVRDLTEFVMDLTSLAVALTFFFMQVRVLLLSLLFLVLAIYVGLHVVR